MRYVLNEDKITGRATSLGMIAETFEEQRIIKMIYNAFRTRGTHIKIEGENGEEVSFKTEIVE